MNFIKPVLLGEQGRFEFSWGAICINHDLSLKLRILDIVMLNPLTIFGPHAAFAFFDHKIRGEKKIIQWKEDQLIDYYDTNQQHETIHKLVSSILWVLSYTACLLLGKWLFSFPSLAFKSYGLCLMLNSLLYIQSFFNPEDDLQERTSLPNSMKNGLFICQIVLLTFVFSKKIG